MSCFEDKVVASNFSGWGDKYERNFTLFASHVAAKLMLACDDDEEGGGCKTNVHFMPMFARCAYCQIKYQARTVKTHPLLS